MTHRVGHTYRIHDFGPFTVGISPNGKGGCYAPQWFIVWRRRGWFAPLARRKNPHVIIYTRGTWTLPHLTWATAYRLKRVPGVLRLYSLQQRFVYAVSR